MNKKVIGFIGIIILLCLIIGIVLILFNKKESGGKLNENMPTLTNDNKILVVYYSATNNTKTIAEKISQNLNADLFEIIPRNPYTSSDLDWTDNNSRVSKEHDDKSLRNVELENTIVDNWDSYDTILIGYPIWWGIAAWPVDSFVSANNFEGKNVIPFCTSASSGIGESDELLASKASSGNWVSGHRFSSSASDSSIKDFTDSLK